MNYGGVNYRGAFGGALGRGVGLAALVGLGLAQGALAQAPSTDILLIDLPALEGAPHTVAADELRAITDREGYDNQPSFTPDSAAVLYVSESVPEGEGEDAQTDIYRYLLETGESERVTDTPESEFSPTVTPDGEHIAAVRIEADGVTQRLWRFNLTGEQAEPNPESIDRVGYYAFVDADNLALVRVDEETNGLPLSLHLTNLATSETQQLSGDVGVGVQQVPGQAAVSFVQRLEDERSSVGIYNLASGETRDLTETLPDVDAHAWLPDGTLLMAQGSVIYSYQEGQDEWQPFLDFSEAGVSDVGRLSVSPDGSSLAFVINR